MIVDMKLWKEYIYGHKIKNLSTGEENLQKQAKINFDNKKDKTEVSTEWLLGILAEADSHREQGE